MIWAISAAFHAATVAYYMRQSEPPSWWTIPYYVFWSITFSFAAIREFLKRNSI